MRHLLLLIISISILSCEREHKSYIKDIQNNWDITSYTYSETWANNSRNIYNSYNDIGSIDFSNNTSDKTLFNAKLEASYDGEINATWDEQYATFSYPREENLLFDYTINPEETFKEEAEYSIDINTVEGNSIMIDGNWLIIEVSDISSLLRKRIIYPEYEIIHELELSK